jgi:hypothetical protein
MLETEREPDQTTTLRAVAILSLVYFFFYAQHATSYVLAIDDEFPPFIGYDYWLTQGRWSMYLLTWLVPNTTLPFVPFVLFGLFGVFAYLILLRALGVRNLSLAHYFIFPVFIAFPTWAFLADFRNNMPGSGMALALTAMAALTFRRLLLSAVVEAKRPSTSMVVHATVCIALGAAAIGVYQSFLLAQTVLYLSVMLALLCAGSLNARQVVPCLAIMAGLLAFSLAAYVLIAKAALIISGQDLSYVQVFFKLDDFLALPGPVIYRTGEQALGVYLGFRANYGAISCFLVLPLVLAFFGLARVAAGNGRAIALPISGLVIVILAVPFAINLMAGGTMPTRSFVAVPVAITALCVIGVGYTSASILRLALILSPLVYLHILQISSQFYANRILARTHDQLLAGAIYERIAQVIPDMSPEQRYRIDFYGAKPFVAPFQRPPNATGGYSFFEWDGGSTDRILNYLRLIGFTNLDRPDAEARASAVPIFESMPVWPAKGSIGLSNGMILVKLGNKSSPSDPTAPAVSPPPSSFGAVSIKMDEGWIPGEKAGHWMSGRRSAIQLDIQTPARGDVELLLEGHAGSRNDGSAGGTLVVRFDDLELGRLALPATSVALRHRLIVPETAFNDDGSSQLKLELEGEAAPFRLDAVSFRDADMLFRFEGFVDVCGTNHVIGWALADGAPVGVTLLVDGSPVAFTVTSVERPDLKTALLPTYAGFRLVPAEPIPAGSEIIVRLPNGEPLPGSPCTP